MSPEEEALREMVVQAALDWYFARPNPNNLTLTKVEVKLLEDLQVKTTERLELATRELRKFLSDKNVRGSQR